jgi:hypothetical protein
MYYSYLFNQVVQLKCSDRLASDATVLSALRMYT